MSPQLPYYAGGWISDPILPALCQAWPYILQSNNIDATHGLTLAKKTSTKIITSSKSAPALQLIIRWQPWAHAFLAAITWHEITLTTIRRSTNTTDALPSPVLHSSKTDSTPSLVLLTLAEDKSSRHAQDSIFNMRLVAKPGLTFFKLFWHNLPQPGYRISYHRHLAKPGLTF
jgi:hypothetical protein